MHSAPVSTSVWATTNTDHKRAIIDNFSKVLFLAILISMVLSVSVSDVNVLLVLVSLHSLRVVAAVAIWLMKYVSH